MKNIKGKEKVTKVMEDSTPAEPVLVNAVVYNGSREVRRYSFEDHGKNFNDLAEEFANKRNFTVKLEEVKTGIKCPSCGHVFIPA